MKQKTFYVTTPIYYPSGNLHIGHAYTTTIAWVLRNYKKAQGYDAIMLTGADEHGQKIEQKAKENKMKPQEYVDGMSLQFKHLWKSLYIDYDLFSRTTSKEHNAAVQSQFSNLYKKGYIFKGKYKGLYSIQDEEFFTKTQAISKNGKYFHPTSQHELEHVEEESYFFKMSEFANWISKYYEDNKNFILPKKIVSELQNNFIKKGLEDLSVSRSTFEWGIKIKEDPSHVIYVWLDALNNYITKLGYNQIDSKMYQKYWKNGDEIVHVVGKEITRFHCIYWPIILKANNLRLPNTILSHGWIVTPDGKMSKSKGNVIDPMNIIKKFGAEQFKYYLSSQITIGQDGVFDEKSFINTINADLSNNIGNLISRTIAMTIQNFEDPIQFNKTNKKEDIAIIKSISEHFENYQNYFNSFKISYALKEAISLSKKLNGYIDITKPWLLKENKTRLAEVLNVLLNGIYAVCAMLNVVMPKNMDTVLKQLNIEKYDFSQVLNFNKFDNVIVEKGKILFERIKN